MLACILVMLGFEALMIVIKVEPLLFWVMTLIFILYTVVLILQKKGILSDMTKPKHRTGSFRTRIKHPHYEEDTDYECGTCGKRFGKPYASCPHCGVSFNCEETDETEYEDEEDEEWDMMEEEDGW